MITQRRPLASLSLNNLPNKELSPYERGKIVGARSAGVGLGTIAKAMHTTKSTVQTTLRRQPVRHEGHSQPRSGRPAEYSDRDVRRLVRYVRLHPKHSYEAIRKDLGWSYSTPTLKRMLEPSGITNWRAKRRPELTPAVAQKRYQWP